MYLTGLNCLKQISLTSKVKIHALIGLGEGNYLRFRGEAKWVCGMYKI